MGTGETVGYVHYQVKHYIWKEKFISFLAQEYLTLRGLIEKPWYQIHFESL